MEFVNGKDDIPYMEKSKSPNLSKPSQSLDSQAWVPRNWASWRVWFYVCFFLINAPIIKLGTTQITALLLTQIKKWNNINSNKLQELENPIFFKESFCFFQLLSRFFHGNIPLKSRTSQGYSMSSSTTPNLGPVRRPQLRAIDLRRRFKSCWWFRIMVVMPRFHKTTPTFKKMFESVHCT